MASSPGFLVGHRATHSRDFTVTPALFSQASLAPSLMLLKDPRIVDGLLCFPEACLALPSPHKVLP